MNSKNIKTNLRLRAALLSWGLFALATLFGMRAYVCVLSFTSPSGAPIGSFDVFWMLLYVFLFAMATTIAPICMISLGLEYVLRKFQRPKLTGEKV